jgi:hypothetical protein
MQFQYSSINCTLGSPPTPIPGHFPSSLGGKLYGSPLHPIFGDPKSGSPLAVGPGSLESKTRAARRPLMVLTYPQFGAST